MGEVLILTSYPIADMKPKILIRRRHDGLFFEGTGKWTDKREVAKDFGSVEIAVSFSFKSALRRVEVVISYHDGEPELLVFRSLN